MPAPPLKITVLGSGTSVGVPTIGCHYAVCTSTDPRDNRLRPSILIGYEGRNVLIDTTPDFRTQALRAKIEHLDAVLFTHAHADHVMGLDDLRPFNFRQSGPIPIYASPETMTAIRRSFPYIFDGGKKESNVPRLDARLLDGAPFDLFGVEFLPIPVLHGSQTIYGFRFGAAAYLTDHSDIPESSLEMLRSLDVPVPRRAALQAAPHAFHRGPVRQDRGKTGASPRLLHAHLSRPGARARRKPSAAAHPAGVRRPRNPGGRRGLIHENLPQPG